MTDQQLKDAWATIAILEKMAIDGEEAAKKLSAIRSCVQACQDAKDQEDEIEADNIDQSNKPEEP